MIISDSKNGYRETKLELSHNVNLSFSEFDDKVSINYIEESPDAWYSDKESSIDIEPEQAKDIIRMFVKMYGNEILNIGVNNVGVNNAE